jgi:uncharacterized membrane protein YkoI
MITRSLYVLIVLCMVVISGCPKSSTIQQIPSENTAPTSPAPKVRTIPSVGQKHMPKPDSPELAACKELVWSHNIPTIIAVRAAKEKAAGAPVEVKETMKNGQTVYHVLIQGQSGKPKLIEVGQREIDDEKLADPSSAADCQSLDESKVERIITAMRIAVKSVPGRLEKATVNYKGYFVYTVTILDSGGKDHVVQVDSESMKILTSTGGGK